MPEAVILMGGQGTRLASISNGRPKPMMPIGGRPFVYRLLDKLCAAGFSRIVLSLHYEAQKIIDQITTDNPVGCELVYVTEDEPLGTGGAIKLAAREIQGDQFLVVNGDTYSSLDYSNFLTSSHDEDFVIAGVYIDDAARYGALSVNEDGFLQAMREKGITGNALINSGTYKFKKNVFEQFEFANFSLETDVIPKYYGKIKIFSFTGEFIDIGVPEDYLLACEYFK